MPVKKYDRKDRSKPYGVKWGHWKNPKFKFFDDSRDRDDFLAAMVKKEKEEGFATLKISTLEAQIMKRCIDLVGSPERVLSICEAEAGRLSIDSIQTAGAVKEYLDEKLNIGRDENYQRNMRNILNRFSAAYPGSRISTLTKDQARNWILSLTYAPSTVKNHQKTGASFFNWCIQRGYARENIFRDVPMADVIMPEPEFLDLCQIKKILGAAVSYYPDTIAYLALQAFAGLRTSACSRINPENIKFDQKGILIRSDMAKNKRRIYIDGHPPVLWKWLQFASETAPEGFTLSKRLYDRRKEQIAKKTGFRMPHNALRHSFCTYHIAMNGDAGKTATLLTHRGNVEILYEHYRGNATQKEGSAWFNLIPPN